MIREYFNVYFANSFLAGCYYVRCLLPMREGGWWGDRTSMRTERLTPEMQARATTEADIVVFHRPNDERSLEAATLLRSAGKKIVMDNDDTYKGLDTMKLGKVFNKIDKAIDEFAKFADLVTCSTEFLAEEYRKLNAKVVVLPNCVDPEDWPEPDEILRNDSEKVRIGITGSVGLNSDIDEFRWALQKLSDRDDVQLVLFALPPKDETTVERVQKMYEEEYKFWESLNIEWQPFVAMEDYIETLNGLRLDMIVIPRKDDYFNRCKSNLKFLEASMLEIPVVAQGFPDGKSPYQGEEDEKYMDIVVDKWDWMKAIEPLVQDKEMRRKIGQEAREYVSGKYAIEKNIHLWQETYQSLLS